MSFGNPFDDTEPDGPEIVLCAPCSDRMTDPKNWLGVGPLEQPFDCVICAKTFCKHLRKDGYCAVCLDCGKDQNS